MSRYYVWRGEIYPSVTTILQVIAKPALVRWAARQVAEAAVAQAEAIARLAPIDPDAAIEQLVRAPWREKTGAAWRGSAVHKAIETVVHGGRLELAPDTEPMVRSVLAFFTEKRPDVLLTETAVYSRQYRYAGTFDALARIDGKTYLLDYKTSRALYPEYTLQLAAYRFADFIGREDGTEMPLPDVDATALVHLTPDGYRFVEVEADRALFEVFLAALRLSSWLAGSSAPSPSDALE